MSARVRLVRLKVRAGSRESVLRRRGDDAYEASVRSPAERGLANREALGLLAGALGLSPAKLRIIKGTTTPAKIVQVWVD